MNLRYAFLAVDSSGSSVWQARPEGQRVTHVKMTDVLSQHLLSTKHGLQSRRADLEVGLESRAQLSIAC